MPQKSPDFLCPLRGLIDKIELQPVMGPEGKPMLGVDLHGALAGLLHPAVGLPVTGAGSPARVKNSGASAGADSQCIDIVEDFGCGDEQLL